MSDKLKKVIVYICFFLLLGAITATFIGCEHLNEQQISRINRVGKRLAKESIIIGLQKLGDSVKEVKPFVPKLEKLIQVTFAETNSPDATASGVAMDIVDVVPDAHTQDIILNSVIQSLKPSASETQSSLQLQYSKDMVKYLKK